MIVGNECDEWRKRNDCSNLYVRFTGSNSIRHSDYRGLRAADPNRPWEGQSLGQIDTKVCCTWVYIYASRTEWLVWRTSGQRPLPAAGVAA
ncbi:MAG UNVERIFIED_CONTAM: hypothetical protein LVR18_17345 [Planctomycetaceae bacterium]